MSSRQAKFCLDRNSVRWVLLEGVITRTTQLDDPTAGKTLPVSQITGIEKASVERVSRSPLAKPAIYVGAVLLALFGWLAASTWALALPGLALGAIVLFWGLVRLPGQKEVLAAYQILAPGTHPPEWQLVGSHTEVLGFIDGLRRDMQEIQAEKAATRN
jgi:hypothetical protein